MKKMVTEVHHLAEKLLFHLIVPAVGFAPPGTMEEGHVDPG